MMKESRVFRWLVSAVGLFFQGTAWSSTPVGMMSEQRFDLYSEAARLETLIERMYRTPEHRRDAELSIRRWFEHLLAAGRIQDRRVLETPFELVGQTVDLGAERFDLFVPSRRPAQGYGLLVFIPADPVFRLPRGWRHVLEARGIILVTPRNAGNSDSLVLRRFPLALHALKNVGQRYLVDPARSYVGGWSGGARTAQALVLAYPELFRGALMIAGSFPIGNSEPSVTLTGDRLVLFPNPLPADDALLARLRSESRLVMLTGEQDTELLRWDVLTLQSMREAEVDGSLIRVPRLGHVVPEARWLERALRMLDPAN